MNNNQGTAIIRERGQLTIPDKIRQLLKWSSANSVVSIKIISENTLLIKPYEPYKKIEWDKIWEKIETVRSYKGKKGNLSSFIVSDREAHK